MKNLFKSFVVFAVLTAASGVCAAQYDIKHITPEVQRALESRRSRFEQLRDLKAKGVVGENNRGYVELLQSNAAVKPMVESENRDRRIIYMTIAEQNGLERQLSLIEEVFAKVQRDKAESGEKVQDADGRWIQK